jgi:ferredoxin
LELSEIDGHATAVAGELDPEAERLARLAVAGCPEHAIALVDHQPRPG